MSNRPDPTAQLQRLLSQAQGKIYLTRLAAGASTGLRVGTQIALGIAFVRLLAAFILPPAERPLAVFLIWTLIVIAVSTAGALLGLLLQLSKRPSFTETAERLDLALKSDNRIATALDFSRQSKKTPFMLAAIEDGIARVQTLYRARPVMPPIHWKWKHRFAYLSSAIVLAAVSSFVGRTFAPHTVLSPDGTAANASSRGSQVAAKTQLNGDQPKESPRALAAVSPDKQGKADQQAQESPQAAAGQNNAKAGAPAGRSASAKTSYGSSGSSGSGLDGQASTGNARQKQPKPSTPKASKPQLSKSDEQQNGAKGASAGGVGGSGQMQAVSQNGREQNVPDHSNVDELDGDLQDADENKNSPSHGSVQPMPSDRNASPSRELGLPGNKGLGGTGRGGPTPPKKSRGTGSMLLGVATPDFVPGQMRPGPSRVTHDEAPPQVTAGGAETPAQVEPRTADETAQDRFDPDIRLTDALLQYFKALHAPDSDQDTSK